MSVRNLADPDYEPSDAEFQELMERASVAATARHAEAMAALRKRISEARAAALRSIEPVAAARERSRNAR